MFVVFMFHFYSLNCAYYTNELALVFKIPCGMTISKTIALKIPLIPLKMKNLSCRAPFIHVHVPALRMKEVQNIQHLNNENS